MPIEFNPPRRLLEAFIRYRARKRQPDMRTGPHLTEETIEASNRDGTYQVKGKNVGQAGEAQLRAGETAVVAWKDANTPTVVLAHSARRIKPVGIAPPPVGLGVEEIIILNDGNLTKQRSVYFRNGQQLTLLPTTVTMPGAPDLRAAPRWGFGPDRLLMVTFGAAPSHRSDLFTATGVNVYKLNRRGTELYGARKPVFTLERSIISMFALPDGPKFATVSATNPAVISTFT